MTISGLFGALSLLVAIFSTSCGIPEVETEDQSLVNPRPSKILTGAENKSAINSGITATSDATVTGNWFNNTSNDLCIEIDANDGNVRIVKDLQVDGRIISDAAVFNYGIYARGIQTGNILAGEIKVTPQWHPDFVFEDDYKLMKLSEVERYINKNGHLPGIPSAKVVAANGIALGESHARLLQKIEELTLHLIKQEKQIAGLRKLLK